MKINGIKEANILELSLANFIPSGKLQTPYSQTCITNILWPKLCMAAYACKAKAREVQVGGQSELKREILSQKIKVIVLIKIQHWEHFVLFYRSVCGGSWLSDPSPHISTLLVVL